MEEQKTIAKGTFWALLSQFIVKFISFIYLIIIARFFPQQTVGLFYLSLSIVGLLYVFSDLGIVFSLSRYIPIYYAKGQFQNLRKLIHFAYAAGSSLTLLFASVIFLFADSIAGLLSQPELSELLRFLSAWFFFQELFDISRGILTARKRIKDSQLLDVFLNIIRLILTFISFYLFGFTILSLILPYLVAFAISTLLALFYVNKEISHWPSKQSTSAIRYVPMAKEVVSLGFVIMMTSTLWVLMQHIDRIMLEYMIPNALAPIGIYSVAIGLAGLILIFPGALSAIFFPVISELYGKEKLDEMQHATAVSIKWITLLCLPFTLIMVIFPSELLQLFYGSSYSSGSTVLMIFSVGLFIRSLSWLLGYLFVVLKRQDLELKIAIVTVIVNILLNLLLIPMFGIEGAALASSTAFILITLLLFYYSKKLFNFSLSYSAFQPILAGFVTLVILLLAKPFLLSFFDAFSISLDYGIYGLLAQKLFKLLIFGLLSLLVSFIYFLMLLIFKALGKEEIKLMQSALRRAKIPEKYINYTNWLMNYSS